MKKTHKVVMLPTEKASHIHFVTPKDNIGDNYEKVHDKLVPLKTNKLLYTDNTTEYGFPPQHLYIISDDEIKEGDWYIDDTNSVRQSITSDKDYWDRRKDYKKIVATTDKLNIHPNIADSYRSGNCLPQLSESFIQAYIKAYNEGKPITEVDLEILECERHEECDGNFSNSCSGIKIKTRPDNTVIVHQSKMYSRDEVEKLCRLAYQQGQEEEAGNPHVSEDKWIQENL